jgi:hypothetical protein
MIYQLDLIHWLLITLCVILASVCLILAIKQFTVKFPISRRSQIIRSLWIGGLTVLMAILVLIITGVLIWARTGIIKSMVLVFPMLSIVPFVFLLTVIGTYIQFSWYEKLSRLKEDLIKRQSDH